ncbi:MAG: DNA-protecting protein DprA, partial [Thermoleophilaceae bacterium]|nr:DNA-protecting protein DprA [Thermoleophilaceae bacterium]
MLRAVACGVVAGPEVSLHAARPAWKQLLAAQERETATTSSAREAAVSAAIAADLRAMYLRLVAGASDHLLTSVCRHDALYPLGLHDLCDAPQVIHICGDVNRLKQLTKQPTVAVVGARRATAQGREVAYRLGRETAAAGVTVVSGMAFGVDAAAHRGALAADGQTIAVLAGAPSRAYPSSNAALHREIIADGLVISEFPPGAKVARWSFPARNRLIAALAQLTVIVEGRRGSGSIHTAEFAAELGRMVAAVPGSVVS